MDGGIRAHGISMHMVRCTHGTHAMKDVVILETALIK